MNAFKVGAIVWLGFWLLASLVALGMAWDHNPQGEYWDYTTGEVHWLPFLGVGLSWFVIVGVFPVLVAVGARVSVRRIAEHIRERSRRNARGAA